MINEEISKFTSIASEWWDINGPFKMLHEITPIRLEYITSKIKENFSVNNKLDKLKILDAGCGGGLLSIPLSRLGANIHGVDLGKENIEAAKLKASRESLNVNFETKDISRLVEDKAKYDVVICSEVLEHVDNVQEFISSLAKLVNKDGILIMTTLNRTYKSKLFAIYLAEYFLRILPVGTHEWSKFITPSEMSNYVQSKGLKAISSRGMTFDIFKRYWKLSNDMDVNYFMTFKN